MGGETRGPFFHLPSRDHGTVCTEITDTVAARMGGCSALQALQDLLFPSLFSHTG